MRTAVDTNVLSEILHGTPRSKEAASLMTRAQQEGALVICPVVYSELLASPFLRQQQVQAFLRDRNIALEHAMDVMIWQEAGLRFGKYAVRRRRSGGGEQQRLLADFIVGAHALLDAERLLTFDVRRYRTDFPELKILEMRAV